MSLATNLQTAFTDVATQIKSLKTMINGNSADLSSLTTTTKTNLVAAMNELKAAIGTPVQINDTTPGSTTTYSSTKINSQITAAINALTTGAPTALDTLDELAAALGDDANFAATVTTALGNRLRYDAVQTLTGPQQVQARANIDAASATAVGDTTTNFAATFAAGLV